jgi:hypothetical protein
MQVIFICLFTAAFLSKYSLSRAKDIDLLCPHSSKWHPAVSCQIPSRMELFSIDSSISITFVRWFPHSLPIVFRPYFSAWVVLAQSKSFADSSIVGPSSLYFTSDFRSLDDITFFGRLFWSMRSPRNSHNQVRKNSCEDRSEHSGNAKGFVLSIDRRIENIYVHECS